MLKQAELLDSFWAKAIATKNLINNRTLMRILDKKTLEELWTGHLVSISSLCVFGCQAYVLLQSNCWCKLDAKAYPCVYLGPENNGHAFRLYNPETKKVFIFRNCLFNESILELPASLDQQDRLQFIEQMTAHSLKSDHLKEDDCGWASYCEGRIATIELLDSGSQVRLLSDMFNTIFFFLTS